MTHEEPSLSKEIKASARWWLNASLVIIGIALVAVGLLTGLMLWHRIYGTIIWVCISAVVMVVWSGYDRYRMKKESFEWIKKQSLDYRKQDQAWHQEWLEAFDKRHGKRPA